MSSLLLSVPPQWILLDCGEGTANQLLRVEQDGVAALARIQWIVISHSHADHHLGLPLLLTLLASFHASAKPNECDEKRAKTQDRRPLVIIGPPRVRVFLEMWSCFVPAIANTFTYIDICIPEEARSIARPLPDGILTEEYPDGRFGVSCLHDALSFMFVPVGKKVSRDG